MPSPLICSLSEVSRNLTLTTTTTAKALSRYATRVQRVLGIRGEVNICVTSNREMQQLNRRFRKKNKATDVLSFPSSTPGIVGDIAISLQIAAANAEDLDHSLADEVKILILHGMLHLAGLDHEIDNGEMRARESALRAKFGLPVGLIERSNSVPPKTAKRGGRRA